jgi:hypothetical protein
MVVQRKNLSMGRRAPSTVWSMPPSDRIGRRGIALKALLLDGEPDDYRVPRGLCPWVQSQAFPEENS